MKKFKEILAETSRGGGGMQPQYGRYAVGYSPAVISKINSIIGRYCIEDLVDPYSAIYRIRGSLNNLGLTFDDIDDDAMIEDRGSMSYPLTAFGGRFGKDTDTPFDEFLNDDGISDKIEGGLSLNIGYEMTEANCYKITAKIE